MGAGITRALRWGLPVLISGLAAVAGLAQLMRPGLKVLGWAAYPLVTSVIFLLGAVAMVPLVEWLL